MVCIIDDREEVWRFTPNMVKVKPYHFFERTADINAPPGMERKEKDSETLQTRTVTIHKVPKSKNTEPAQNGSCEGSKAKPGVTEAMCEDNSDHNSDAAVTSTVSDDTKMLQSSDASSDRTDSAKSDAVEADQCGEEGSQAELVQAAENVGEELKTSLQGEDTVGCIHEAMLNDMEVSSSESEADLDEASVSASNKITAASCDVTPAAAAAVDKQPITDSSTGQEAKPNAKSHPCTTRDTDTKQNSDTKSDSDAKPSTDSKPGGDSTSESKQEADSSSKAGTIEDEYDEIIEWEDRDDYLLYLEEILKNVHKIFFDMYDELQQQQQKSNRIREEEKPNLKKIVPYAKQKVLQGVNIVFSGVVPTNMQLERSRPYAIARSLGAVVQTDVVLQGDTRTTHVVAARLGTVKVKEALKRKGTCRPIVASPFGLKYMCCMLRCTCPPLRIHAVNVKYCCGVWSPDVAVVSTDWLWHCEWRWERVDERLFLLDEKSEYCPDSTHQREVCKLSDSLILVIGS